MFGAMRQNLSSRHYLRFDSLNRRLLPWPTFYCWCNLLASLVTPYLVGDNERMKPHG